MISGQALEQLIATRFQLVLTDAQRHSQRHILPTCPCNRPLPATLMSSCLSFCLPNQPSAHPSLALQRLSYCRLGLKPRTSFLELATSHWSLNSSSWGQWTPPFPSDHWSRKGKGPFAKHSSWHAFSTAMETWNLWDMCVIALGRAPPPATVRKVNGPPFDPFRATQHPCAFLITYTP